MRPFLLVLLRIYRAAISPMVGPCCRFEPSCSAYAEEALHTHSVPRALALVAWRLLRCHPFARGGLDPVPPRRPRAALPVPARARAGEA
jgi:putative membrane protein insertion efficiency factor